MARRRMLYGREEEYVELPDYIKIIKTTTTENEKLYVGYYALSTAGNCGFKDLIIDGVNYYNDSSCWKSAENSYIVLKDPGEHVIYLKIVPSDYVNGNYFVGTRSQFPVTFSCAYLRIPPIWFAIQGQLICTTLDLLNPTPLALNKYSWYLSAGKIRVPIESVDAYKQHANWSTFANKIEGYDFKYKT